VFKLRGARARAWMVAFALAAITACALSAPVSAQDSSQATGGGALPTPNCGTEPVELLAYFETGFALPRALADEFTSQFPNVTWNIREDQFTNLMEQTPRLLAGDDPPDLVRLPTMVDLVKDGLLKNLDPYVTAYGWDQWPPAMLVQNRVNESGQRGDGSLFAAGLNYSMTGVFYNKALAEQIGMTDPPATLEAFEGYLAAAKEAGLQPIMQWGSARSGMGLAFPLQNLMASLGETGPINDWIFQKEGATIDTPSNLEAAQHLEQWIQNGTFRLT
jgi:raffinose/stachyose/melibiose transport system substrate-binding protein